MLPDGWRVQSVLELGRNDPNTVQTGPFGSQLHAEDYTEEGVPLLLIRNIGENGLLLEGLPRISEHDAKRLAKYALQPGDVVFSRVGRVGSCFLATDDQNGWIISGQTLRIRVPYDNLNPQYFLYALRYKEAQDFVSGASVGTTRSSINTSILKSLPVRIPPCAEQTVIADILTTVDRAIEQTEALIAKQRRIKAGLLHDLLTRGIDEHGQLRDPSTHRFKPSPLGLVPEEWKAETLGAKCIRVTDGVHMSIPKGSGDIPFLFVSCIKDGKILWEDASTITESVYEVISQGRTPMRGLVLYTIVGSYGNAAVVTDDRRFSFQRHIGYLLPYSDELRPDFLSFWLNSEPAKRIADAVAFGNAQKTITLTQLKQFPVILPSLSEQDRIIAVLQRNEREIYQLLPQVSKLNRLKVGLMQDLLSGRVSVAGLV